MNPTPHLRRRRFGTALLLGLSAGLTFIGGGCATTSSDYYGRGQAVTVVEPDDYIYYPGYEVYYSNQRHYYLYRDRDRWISTPRPPRYWNRGAPYVRMGFHDSPERHHSEVIRTYPRNWRPGPGYRDRDGDGYPDRR
jgi:hypothetical protein